MTFTRAMMDDIYAQRRAELYAAIGRAPTSERRLYEIEQAASAARATQRALIEHARQGELRSDEGIEAERYTRRNAEDIHD
jgi:hypothetical protein